MAACRRLIHEHSTRHGISAADADAFFTTVQRNAVRAGALNSNVFRRRDRRGLGGCLRHKPPVRTGGVGELLDEIQFIAVRMWTTAATLAGRELCAAIEYRILTRPHGGWSVASRALRYIRRCAIINEAVREDAVDNVVVLVKALNAFCVTRSGGGVPRPVRWPDNNRSLRGGGLPPQHRAFFTPGRKYRAPMFVATSPSSGTS